MKSLCTLLVSIIVLSGCAATSKGDSGPSVTNKKATSDTQSVVRIAVIGDVACSSQEVAEEIPFTCAEDRVAKLIRANSVDKILIPGDVQYESGSYSEYLKSFNAFYGNRKTDILPAPGNHDYGKGNLDGYKKYFGERVLTDGSARYVTGLGNWKLISLDSNCTYVGCNRESDQFKWVSSALIRESTKCTIAMWHHPRFSSGKHGNSESMNEIWKTVANSGVDIVVNGHEHTYERFEPMNANGNLDPNGVREFVAGTGGRSLYFFSDKKHNSAKRVGLQFGALFINLRSNGYDWKYLNTEGEVLDRASGICN